MPRLTRRSFVQHLRLDAAPRRAGAGAAAQTRAARRPQRPDAGPSASRTWCAAPASSPRSASRRTRAPLPERLNRLDFDAYRDIRFRPDKALLGSAGGPFRMQLFHLGFLYQRPVTVNMIRDGVPTPGALPAQLFDYGRNKIDRPLPVNLGFAGFRLHYPLNDPKVLDELIAFLGASYFRFLGRNQRYGLSARGLASMRATASPRSSRTSASSGSSMPAAGAERALVYALLDGPSLAGAYRFDDLSRRSRPRSTSR